MNAPRRASPARVLGVAFAVAGVCSVIVSSAALLLRDKQRENILNEQHITVLRAAGEEVDGETNVAERFADFATIMVDLRSGQLLPDQDPTTWDLGRDLLDSDNYDELPPKQDAPKLRWLEKRSRVYFRCEAQGLEVLVLPVRGYGLWGTLYGYLALEGDLRRVRGLEFYAHKETPGLGGEVENPRWKAQWVGREIYDDAGAYSLEVVKGRARDRKHQIDGLAGATLTTRGVDNLVRFWLGDMGFAPLLERLQGGRCPV